MHTKQLLKSKLNLYCTHFPFLSRDWTTLDPHSFKFHASPLNPAYQKRLLSGFPPCALRWVFKTQIKAVASVAGKKTLVPWLCPSVCIYGPGTQDLGSASLEHPIPAPFCGPENETVALYDMKNAVGQKQSARHVAEGIHACDIHSNDSG